eukprot:scaffold36388_cov46-Attheya_sp.AAC.4
MSYCDSCDTECELGYGCCSKDIDGSLCDICSINTKTTACDKCNDEFCEDHGDMDTKHECCGMTLCGSEDFIGCEEEHNPKKLKCGHMGCDYYTKKGCRACNVEEKKQETAMLQDKERVEALLKKSKSKTLKKSLSAWLKTVPKDSSSKKNVKKKRVSTQATAAGASKKHKSGNERVYHALASQW